MNFVRAVAGTSLSLVIGESAQGDVGINYPGVVVSLILIGIGVAIGIQF